ncbi:hypothetical protein B0H11DRAFT_2224950 [Mycena galericulata]|nr:hypothetical protein B0H11DRAFT_2224950 [Mycena galericulata]
MVPLPNVQLLYGPMIIGVFFNMILYGVLVGQILTYHQVYKKDPVWIRLFVAFLFFVETSNTALDISMMYQSLILEYGQQPVFLPTEPLCVVLVSMPIQLFFAWRIHQLTKSLWIPLVISVFAIGSFAGGIWTSAMVQILREFAKKPLLNTPALLWFLASCVADVLITISLVITLELGSSAVFSILDVVCFMALPRYAVNFVWDLALSKLYSNCLLSSLNARQSLNNVSHLSNSVSHLSAFQQQRNVMVSPGGHGGSGGKQDSFLDGPPGNVIYNADVEPDLEYGIHMTKIVEGMEDPKPRV